MKPKRFVKEYASYLKELINSYTWFTPERITAAIDHYNIVVREYETGYISADEAIQELSNYHI